MLCLCEIVAFAGPGDEPRSNGIVSSPSRSWLDLGTTQCRSYWHAQTGTNSHKDKHTLSSSTPKQTPFHSVTHAWFISRSYCATASPPPLPVYIYFFPFRFTLHYLSIYLSIYSVQLSLPPISSPLSGRATGLCPFIIHGVVLMAQAAMSDVNLCNSKAHSACTASARRVTAPATVLRYHTGLNQHAQSHLNHTANANCFCAQE